MAQRSQTWPLAACQNESHNSISDSSTLISEEASEQSERQSLAEVPDPQEAKPPSPSEPRTKPSKWEAIFRSLGLGIIFTKFAKRDTEYPKVAIWKCRTVALPKIILHVVPLSTSIFLVAINMNGYWVGTEISGIQGYNSAKLGGLQFAAKMNEIFIMASLSMVVFTLVQIRLVSQKVAFGSIFSGLQFGTLSYLWSKELWEVIVSEWGQPYGRLFVVTLLLAMVLAPTVGPSSAVLMVPKLQDWPAGGTYFWLNATRDELWPMEVSDSGVNPMCAVTERSQQYELYCPSWGLTAFLGGYLSGLQGMPSTRETDWEIMYYQTYTDAVSLPGTYGSRVLIDEFFADFESFTYASCPSMVLADSLALAGMFWGYASQCSPQRPHFAWLKSAAWSIPNLKKSIADVVCNDLNLTGGILDVLESERMIGFPVLNTSVTSASNVLSYKTANLSNSALASQVLEQLKTNSSQPELLWLELDQSVFGNNSIGVIATLPATSEQGQNASESLACAVDSYWIDVQYQTNTSWAVQTAIDYSNRHRQSSIAGLPSIRINPTWAKYLNPSSSTNNRTLFEELAISAGIWPTGPFSTATTAQGQRKDRANRESSHYILEVILAGMIANGLSTIGAPSFEIQGTLPGPQKCESAWVDPFFPRGPGELGQGAGTVWDMTGIDTTNMTRFTMTVTANGYAYGLSGATSIAAIVVLLVYCTMAVFHTAFLCWTGLSSSSWDSIPELVALAIQSRPTDVLKNTGGGISTAGIFREPVQVLDVGRRLKLTFRDTEDNGVMVEKNDTYG